ncbi:MAG: putative toxin-antitoxin system toxin component, PIN family [Nitrospira sp.]|nr:putative toxin-antitoxin system toxin component, PIN family [Nitrospira sp.]
MRVVLDTNVIVSALSYGGKPHKILSMARKGEIQLVISPFLFDEVMRVLQEKFSWSPDRAERLRVRLRRISQVVTPTHHLKALEDDSDNRILECALEGRAHVIVTGDKDFIRLGVYRNIPILTPAQFLELLKQRSMQ